MKDLTHYFNSPKEDEACTKASTGKSSPDDAEKSNSVEDKAPFKKKRKLSLSKSKTTNVSDKVNADECTPIKNINKNKIERKKNNSIIKNEISDDEGTSELKKLKDTKRNSLKNKISETKREHSNAEECSPNLNIDKNKVERKTTCDSKIKNVASDTVGKSESKIELKQLKRESLKNETIETKQQNKFDNCSKNKKRKCDLETKKNFKKLKKSSHIKSYPTKSDKSSMPEEDFHRNNGAGDYEKINNKETDSILVDTSSNSCDELKVEIKRKKQCILESDEEHLFEKELLTAIHKNTSKTSENIIKHSPANNEEHLNHSKNNLLSYFNKVDKETAVKQTFQKIKVEALVHLPPSKEEKRHSVEKPSSLNKSNKYKKKLSLSVNGKNKEIDKCDTIEIISSEYISDENSSINVNVHVSPSSISKEEVSSSVLPKPNNIASIFISKKVEKQTLPSSKKDNDENESENKSNIKNDENITIKQDIKKPEVKPNKLKKLKHSKKSTNVSEKTSNKCHNNSSDQCTSENNVNNPVKTESNAIDKRKINCITGSPFSNSKKSKLNKENEFVEKRNNDVSENSSTVRTFETDDSVSKESYKTPENKNKTPKSECYSNSKTAKNKCLTINGYFTPNNVPNKGKSEEKNNTSKKTPSWVMKVRLNSPADHSCDFEEDSVDSVQNKKQDIIILNESETSENPRQSSSEFHEETEVVLIDDDDDSSRTQDSNRRKTLPRSAKRLKFNSSEEQTKEEIQKESPKPSLKMWPFFLKAGARQPKDAPVDEAKLKAKLLFLESGIPEVIKRKVDTVKNEAVIGSPAPFPSVSHVTQADEVSSCATDFALRLPPPRSLSPVKQSSWSSVLTLAESEEPEIPVFQRSANVKAYLEKLKEEEPKTEIKVLYKKLKEYKSKAESDVWTEIYKPVQSKDMVGNSESIKKLKTWLETLKNRRKREGSVSSGDEFIDENSDGDSNTINNMALISGPCGCGKTSSVYAIAKELDYKVLEINSSCNRSGKKILAEFSESTQSHQVERTQLNCLFGNQSAAKRKKKKRKTLNEGKSEKTSLILVEDADLLFADMDEGFVQALSSLAASSKRPLILVTNHSRVPHLERFNNTKLLELNFTRPKPAKLGLWLRLIGLVEGVMMSADQASRIVDHNNCDVRRSLLQLQLMVHSNNSEVMELPSTSQLWWQWPSHFQLSYELPTLLEAEEKDSQPESSKDVIVRQLKSIAQTTSRLSFLDVLSTHGRLESSLEDPCPVAWRASCRDGTALTPCEESSQGMSALSCELMTRLAHDLVEENKEHRRQNVHEARWLSILRQGEHYFMSGISSTAHTNHQSVSCDYLPALRELARSEEVRLVSYTRRANRFFNYLQGLGIHASKSYRDFMCDVFS